MTELQPNLTKVTEDEFRTIMDEATVALNKGDRVSFYKILERAPISAGQAQDLKEYMGIEELINTGLNLSKAVEAYGDGWLGR